MLTIPHIIEVVFVPSLIFGLGLGGSIFLLGLGIDACLKLFNH